MRAKAFEGRWISRFLPGGIHSVIRVCCLPLSIAAGTSAAGEAMRPCDVELEMRGESSDSPSRAMTQAWVEIFQLGVESSQGEVLRGWALAGLSDEPARDAAGWLDPPAGALPGEVESAMEGLREMRRSIHDFVEDSSQFDVQFSRGIAGFVGREVERQLISARSRRSRATKAPRIVEDLSLSLGSFASSMTDIRELIDGRLTLLGFGLDSKMLSLLDREAPSTVTPVRGGDVLRNAGASTMGVVEPLPSGGFVAASFSSTIAFFGSDGGLLQSYDSNDVGATTVGRPLLLTDGTVVFVKSNGIVYLFNEMGGLRRGAIHLPAQPSGSNAIVLRDGNFALAAGRWLLVFDSSGNRVGQYEDESPLVTQPVELRDGSVAVGSVSGRFLILERVPGESRFAVKHRLDLGVRLGRLLPVELEGGRIVLSSGNRLFFYDRDSHALSFIPVTTSEKVSPLALPDGGVAVMSLDRFLILDPDGTPRNGEGASLQGRIFRGTPTLITLPCGEWGIMGMNATGVTVLDELGAVLVSVDFVSGKPGDRMAVLLELSDGTFAAATSEAKLHLFRLHPEVTGKDGAP